jgi:hypothetical protein
MRHWKRVAIRVILLSVVFISALTVKWRNEAEASLCPPGHCCMIYTLTWTTPSGVEITLVSTTCGFYSVHVYPNGTAMVIVCRKGARCVTIEIQ